MPQKRFSSWIADDSDEDRFPKPRIDHFALSPCRWGVVKRLGNVDYSGKMNSGSQQFPFRPCSWNFAMPERTVQVWMAAKTFLSGVESRGACGLIGNRLPIRCHRNGCALFPFKLAGSGDGPHAQQLQQEIDPF